MIYIRTDKKPQPHKTNIAEGTLMDELGFYLITRHNLTLTPTINSLICNWMGF